MKKLYIILLIVLALIFYLPLVAADEKEELQVIVKDLFNSYNTGNIDGITKNFIADATIYDQPDTIPTKVTAGDKAELKSLFIDGGMSYNVKLQNIVATVYNGTGIVTALMKGTICRPYSSIVESGPWRLTMVLTEVGRDWKIAYFHISPLVCFDYDIKLPTDYYKLKAQKKWPLIVFLHGMDERGNDLELVTEYGPPLMAAKDPKFPFIVISPQCPATTVWEMEIPALNMLLDDVLEKYSIDPDRVYLTGLSMGGYGVWYWAETNPERFAAIAPICGGGNLRRVNQLKNVPVWAFHGALDNSIPPVESKQMVKALQAYGGDARLTLYSDADHDAWTRTYANPELYKWFLKYARKQSQTQ